MDLREAAGAIGVHYQTAYGWVRHGVLPARKVGRESADIGTDTDYLQPPLVQVKVFEPGG